MTEYPRLPRPDFSRRSHQTTDWLAWMESHSLLAPTAPRPANSCSTCQGAVGSMGKIALDGSDLFYRDCFRCRGYSEHLDHFVPITYSVTTGLESLLHRYKDFGADYSWMAHPLGALLTTFLGTHRSCIELRTGGIDVATFVPANEHARKFNHLEDIIDSVTGSPVRQWFSWLPEILQRNFSFERPGRGEIKSDAYMVDGSAVASKSVLLLDDTWTSGSSLVSCAAALKSAGATQVVGLTIGRQLNETNHYGSTDQILTEVRGRRWTDVDCVFCT